MASPGGGARDRGHAGACLRRAEVRLPRRPLPVPAVGRRAARCATCARAAPSRRAVDESATGFYSATQTPLHTARDARLVVERAPGHAPGMIYDIGEGAVLGRGDAAEIRLEDPYASSRHAQLVLQAGVSCSRTSARPTAPTSTRSSWPGPAPLHRGDRVRIGDSEFTYEEGSSDPRRRARRADRHRPPARDQRGLPPRARAGVRRRRRHGRRAGRRGRLAARGRALRRRTCPASDGDDAAARAAACAAAHDANAEIYALVRGRRPPRRHGDDADRRLRRRRARSSSPTSATAAPTAGATASSSGSPRTTRSSRSCCARAA